MALKRTTSIASLALLAPLASLALLAGCAAGGVLPDFSLPWNAKLQERAAPYRDLGWTAPAQGTLYLVDVTEAQRVLGIYPMRAEEVFTFSPRLRRAMINDQPVEIKQPVNFGHEHEIYFLPR